jgi:hypothetical protein
MVSLTVQNLYVIRTTSLDLSSGVYPAQTRGGTVKFGLVYAPQGSGPEPYLFNGGKWPLAPVWTTSWGVDSGSIALSDYIPNNDYYETPPDYEDLGSFDIISFSDAKPLYLTTDVPYGDSPACYKLAMEVYDPFLQPSTQLGSGTSTIWYTFFAPKADNPGQKLFGSLSIQQLAWTEPQPVNVYLATQRDPYGP